MTDAPDLIATRDGLDTLTGVALPDHPGAVDLDMRDGRITAIRSHPDEVPRWVALPPLVNFHAHADRAFTAPARRSRSLGEAVALAKAGRAQATVADIQARAARLFRAQVGFGVRRIRTHTDVDPLVGLRALEAVMAAGDAVREDLDVEIVAFANAANDPRDPAARSRLTDAVRRGAPVIGAAPAFSADPAGSLDAVLDLAARLSVPADIHLDEHLDVSNALIEPLIAGVVARGLQGRVAVSHACTLAVMARDTVRRVLDGLAEARITLVTLPQLNLYLQDRSETGDAPRRRGLPPLLEAERAGVALRLGTDNVRDWFFPFGDGDPLDSAYLAALGGHFEDPEALTGALCGGRRSLRVGDPADFVLIPGGSFDEALATRAGGRRVIRAGRLIAAPE